MTTRAQIDAHLRELDQDLGRTAVSMRLSVYFHLTHWVHSSDLSMSDYVYTQRRIAEICDRHGVDRRPGPLPPEL